MYYLFLFWYSGGKAGVQFTIYYFWHSDIPMFRYDGYNDFYKFLYSPPSSGEGQGERLVLVK